MANGLRARGSGHHTQRTSAELVVQRDARDLLVLCRLERVGPDAVAPAVLTQRNVQRDCRFPRPVLQAQVAQQSMRT